MTDEMLPHSSPGGERKPLAPRAGSSSLFAIALVGFMGAGKTTVGRALAERMGWRFYDLDDLIQAREGRRVAEIFTHQGEPRFRELEQLVVREILAAENTASLVLGLGGGAFPQEPIRVILQEAGIPAVFLDASHEELYRRSEEPDVVRPMRRDIEQFRQLYERRRPAYLQAHLRIETAGKEISTVVDEIISGLNLKPNPILGTGASE